MSAVCVVALYLGTTGLIFYLYSRYTFVGPGSLPDESRTFAATEGAGRFLECPGLAPWIVTLAAT